VNILKDGTVIMFERLGIENWVVRVKVVLIEVRIQMMSELILSISEIWSLKSLLDRRHSPQTCETILWTSRDKNIAGALVGPSRGSRFGL
jgi:hypothetical protein